MMLCRHWQAGRILPALVAAVMLLGLFSTAVWAEVPEDTVGHWAEEEIQQWLQRGWIAGYEDGTFRPDADVTRAEFVVFVGRAYELPEATVDPGFDDVGEGDWYYERVADAVAAGMITGRDDETFAPDDDITRQEAAVIVDRLLDLDGVDEAPPFFDRDEIADWAEEAVVRAAGAGIITGYDDGTFGPVDPITRAETVVVLERGLDEELPASIEEWVDYSREIMCAQAREYDDALYLLVTYGEQPTGGYGVEITDVQKQPDWLEVTVHFTEPEEGEPVTQALTYPYDLKKVEPTDLPVEFVAEGDTSVVPTLSGLDWLPPMVAGDEDIRVFAPAPGDQVLREFTVEAIELVFEGTVHYRLLDEQGAELESGMASGHAYDWGYLEIDFTVPDEIEYGEQVTAELYSECPVDGSTINLVQMDLTVVQELATLTDARTDVFFCEKYESFEFDVTLQGALPADEALRIDFSAATEHGIIFEGDVDDILVEPGGDISLEPTVPPGLSVISYQPDEKLPDATLVQFEVDPGNAKPPGHHLGCEDEDAWRMSPHEVVFERTDSGYTTSAEMEVAGPTYGSFEVSDEEGQPIEGADVMVNGEEGVTGPDGKVSFELIPADYDYRVEKSGYQADTGGLQVGLDEWSEEVVLSSEGPAALLTLDEEEYLPEEKVQITVENTGQTELHLGDNTFPFSVQRYEEGKWTDVQVDVEVLWVEVMLEPGQTHEASFCPATDFTEDPEPGRYRVVNETTCTETQQQLTLTEEFDIVLPAGVPDPEQSEFEPASVEMQTGEVADIYVTVRDAYADPVLVGTGADEHIVALTAPDGSDPVAYYDWLTRYARYYGYGDDHQMRIELEAHESNTGDADDMILRVDEVVLTDEYHMTVKPSPHTAAFYETQGLEGVQIQVCADEECAEPVGSPVQTGDDGTAQKELVDGDYWFTASADGYLDHRGDFTVAGGEVSEFFEMTRPAALLKADPGIVEPGWFYFASEVQVHRLVEFGEYYAHVVVEISGEYEDKPQVWDPEEEKWVDLEEIDDGVYRYGPHAGFELTGLDGVKGEFRVKSTDEDLYAAVCLQDAEEPDIQLTDRLVLD